METEPVNWESAGRACGEEGTLGELEEFVRTGPKNELPSLRRPLAQGEALGVTSEQNTRSGSLPQDQWNSWFTKRDQMRAEIKRGCELLEQVQRELAVLRARLDEWAGYEIVCGKNPLSEYMQAIAAKERIEQFLPVWLKRREEQLHALDRQMEHNSVRNQVEQLS